MIPSKHSSYKCLSEWQWRVFARPENIIPLFAFYYSIPQFSKKFTIILPNLLYYSRCHDEYLLQQSVLF